MSDNYILIGQTAVPCDDLLEWARWHETADRRVALTYVLGFCRVSTVFLGIDHEFRNILLPDAMFPPLLYETMVFWPGEGGYEQERCSTWLEAERQHERMCRESASLRMIWGWAVRMLYDSLRDARMDASRGWREMRGIPPSEWEILGERMRERMSGIG